MTPDEALDVATALRPFLAEIERLRARILELEAELALLRGTLSKPSQSEPASFTWNEPPTTPGNELP